MTESWPRAGVLLLRELRVGRGRLGLIALATKTNAESVPDPTGRLVRDLGLRLASLGASLASYQLTPSEDETLGAVDDADVLVDLDLLFWPDMRVSPISLLAARARRQLTIAVWPGSIENGRARYSVAGRPDHLDERLSDVVVLNPCLTRYPDEVPFVIEEIAP